MKSKPIAKVYRQTRIEHFLENTLPYHLPFLSKRERVKLRQKYKYAYKRRLMKDLVEGLNKLCKQGRIQKEEPLTNKEIEWKEADYEWEVIK